MDEGRGVALAILGIVAVIAVVGLVMLFSGSTGQGVYGGAMRQGESEIRAVGEEPARYITPMYDPILQQYTQRQGWAEGLSDRNKCPDLAYPVAMDPARAGKRQDCIPSPTRDIYVCCALGGQAGNIAAGLYG